MIAATALEHELTMATRNISDFEPDRCCRHRPIRPETGSQQMRWSEKGVHSGCPASSGLLRHAASSPKPRAAYGVGRQSEVRNDQSRA